MKQLFTISMAFMLLALSARDLVTFAAFKWHQDEIAAKLCINKYDPIPMCFGQCFLEEQLEANKSKSEHPGTTTPKVLSEKIVYFQSPLQSLPVLISISATQPNFLYQGLVSTLTHLEFFQPPRFA